LIPGPEGWEIWQGNRAQGFRRSLENGPPQASEIEKIPSGRLLMGFPVREVLAVPFKVQTEDAAMFDDLAAMHLEKSGIRPEADAGRLTDVFPAGHQDGQTVLLSVVLSAPADGTMPRRAPNAFDVSPRFFAMEENAVTLWRELGRWVFAVTKGRELVYFQSLPGVRLGVDAVREIRLALAQLGLQGVNLEVQRAVVWTTGHDSDPGDDEIQSFAKDLDVEVSAEPKPRPIPPSPMSRLVPADVRAEQRLKAQKQKRNLIIAALLLVYLGIAGWLAYDYYQLDKQLKNQNVRLKKIKLEHADIGMFNADWDQLAEVVDDEHLPWRTLIKSYQAIPQGQVQNLRFNAFEATRTSIAIRGEAANEKLTSRFGEKLRRILPDYDWKLPPAAQPDGKTNRWKFYYTSTLKEGSNQ